MDHTTVTDGSIYVRITVPPLVLDDNDLAQTAWEDEQYERWAMNHACPLCGEAPDYCLGHPNDCPWCLDGGLSSI